MLDKDFKKSLEELFTIQQLIEEKTKIFTEVNAKLTHLPQIKTELFELGDLVSNVKRDIVNDLSKKINTDEIVKLSKEGVQNLEFISDEGIPTLKKAIKEFNTISRWDSAKNFLLGLTVGGGVVFGYLTYFHFQTEIELKKLTSSMATYQSGETVVSISKKNLAGQNEQALFFYTQKPQNQKDKK